MSDELDESDGQRSAMPRPIRFRIRLPPPVRADGRADDGGDPIQRHLPPAGPAPADADGDILHAAGPETAPRAPRPRFRLPSAVPETVVLRERELAEIEADKSRADRIRAAFERYHAAIDADGYRCAVINWPTDEARRPPDFLGGRDGAGKVIAHSASEIREQFIGMAIDRTRRNPFANTYFCPVSRDRHHVLVDDMTGESLARLKAEGYRPALVQKSNAGDNYQAIINLGKIGDETLDAKIGRRVVRELNAAFGDPHVKASVQLHRAPGFTNQKPGHRDLQTNLGPVVEIVEADGGLCPRAAEHAELARSAIEGERRESRERLERARARRLVDPDRVRPPPDVLDLAKAAFKHHAEEIIQRDGDDYQSSWAFKAAQRMAVTGWSAKLIEMSIIDEAPEISKHKDKDWRREASSILAKFDSVDGMAKLEELSEKYRTRWVRFENNGGVRHKSADGRPVKSNWLDLITPARESRKRQSNAGEKVDDQDVDLPPPGF